ncbi:P68 family surface lipoprotein [Candidatus Mycoplasma pogonae]
MNKKLKIFLLASSTISLPITLIACGTNATTTKTTPVAENWDDKVVFQLAQGGKYPLLIPLHKLVPIYNEQFKDTPDFLPVEIQDASVVKAKSEIELANLTAQKLEVIKNETNPSYNQIPNLILNSIEGAFVINQYDALLDLSNTNITSRLFDETLFEAHNKLPGNTTGKIYTIPFDVATLTGLMFNLDIMKLIFDQIVAGGGIVDQHSAIYQKTVNAASEGNAEIPADKFWRYMVTKSPDSFRGYLVNDATFTSLEALMEFADKVYTGLKIDESNISHEIKAKLFADKNLNPSVLSIDYIQIIFEQFLYDYFGVNNSSEITGDLSKFLWSLTQNAANAKQFIEYNYKKPAKKTALLNRLKAAFDTFVQTNKVRPLDIANNSASLKQKAFKSIYFNNHGNSEWSGWAVRDYDSAIGMAPAVGVRQTYLNTYSMEVNAEKKPEIYNGYAKPQDILWGNQITKMQKKSTKNVFYEGGSSLVAISTTPKRNKATTKFIEWLLTGSFKDANNQTIYAKDYITQLSSYIIPTKDRISFAQYQNLKAQKTAIETKLQVLYSEVVKSDANVKVIHDLEAKKGVVEGALLSLEDILLMKGIDLNTGAINEANKATLKFIPMDDITTKIMQVIRQALGETTKTVKNPNSVQTGEALIEAINKIK